LLLVIELAALLILLLLPNLNRLEFVDKELVRSFLSLVASNGLNANKFDVAVLELLFVEEDDVFVLNKFIWLNGCVEFDFIRLAKVLDESTKSFSGSLTPFKCFN